MTIEWVLLSALTVGLLGSGHCLGMCGGIAGAFHASPADSSTPRITLNLVVYNLGRLFSYALAGVIAGAVSFTVGRVMEPAYWAPTLRIATGATIALIGLHLVFRLRALLWLESLGRPVWRTLSPLIAKVRPSHSGQTLRWLALGMLWGWLPCGMVYSMLLVALMSGQAANGAMIMLSFGLGTLPAMVLTGALLTRCGRWFNRRNLAPYTGALCIVLGLWTAAAPFSPMPAYPRHPLSANASVCHVGD